MSYYYTYAIGIKNNNSVYLLSDLNPKTKQRTWTKKASNAMIFYAEEEVQFVIRKFSIKGAAVARITNSVG